MVKNKNPAKSAGFLFWPIFYFVSAAGLDEWAVRKYIEQHGKKDCGQTKFVF